MPLPALSTTADTRTITDRVNVLGRDYNLAHEPFVVADLPPAADVPVGQRAMVTDATATTFRSIVAGGGANTVPVYSDLTNWRIG